MANFLMEDLTIKPTAKEKLTIVQELAIDVEVFS